MAATYFQSSDFWTPGTRYSLALHISVLVFVLFGMPVFFRDDHEPEPSVMVMELVPIKEITNVPTSTPKKQPKEKPKPKPKETPAPPKPKPLPKPEPKKPDSVPLPKPEKPKEKPKERPKEKPKPEPKQERTLKDVLSSLKDLTPEDSATKPDAPNITAKSNKPYNPRLPLSISERDAIRSQIARNWRVPSGVKDAYDLKIRLRIMVQQNGVVSKVEIVDAMRYRSDRVYRAAADSAVRAVWKSSPLRHLPAQKYETWRDMELSFDPREMLY